MKYKLNKIVKIINGSTPSTSNSEYWDGDINWITPKDMSLQMKRYISKGERNITQKGYDSCSTTLVPKGTILLTSRAPIGYISIAQNELCTNQGFKSLVCGDKVLPLFMYYWLSTKVDFLKSIANGATFKELSKQSLENVEIDLPNLETQQHIVDTIGSVDDLIEKYQETDAKIMSLLSMKFKAIKVKNNSIKLEDFAFYQEGPGIRNWQYVDSDGVKFINIRCINDNDMQLDDANMISKEEAYGIYKHFMVQEDDILVSTSGTLGRLAIARKEHLPLCMNTSVIRFRPLVKENYSYLFCFLMSDEFKNLIISMANGSAQLNFGPTHIKKINLLLPEENELKRFNAFAQPLIYKHKGLLSKIDKLKNAKSLLLSKYFN